MYTFVIVDCLRFLRPVLLLPYIVVEMGRHFEVVSFVRNICSETVDAFIDGKYCVVLTQPTSIFGSWSSYSLVFYMVLLDMVEC